MEPIVAIIENGIVANVIVADEWLGGVRIEHLDPRPGIGWAYDGQVFTAPPAPPPEPETPQPRHITRLAFLQRITMSEHVAIELASMHDGGKEITDPYNIRAATLRKMLQLVNAATWIDLGRTDTRELVMQLEAMGMLQPGRALEILDAEIQPVEMPSSDVYTSAPL